MMFCNPQFNFRPSSVEAAPLFPLTAAAPIVTAPMGSFNWEYYKFTKTTIRHSHLKTWFHKSLNAVQAVSNVLSTIS